VRILVLNGPNLGSVGRREPHVYGGASLEEIEALVRARAGSLGVDLRWEQSNHEGELVDLLEEERGVDGCIINPGALAHTSVVLLDAVRAFAKPVIEVHLSNIHAREPYRRRSFMSAAAVGVITGLGPQGYVLALEGMVNVLQERSNDQRG
jgi:3-dehydroquinate dehydratase II